MSNVLVTLEYNANSWSFSDAEEHAMSIATDLGGEIDETVPEDNDTHQIVILVEDGTMLDVREDLYDLISDENLTYRIELAN